MSFTNQMLSMVGAAAAAATMGKSIQNQNEMIENQKADLSLKKVDAEKEFNVANNELENNNFALSTRMETDKDLSSEQREELKGLEPGKDIDRYLEMKSDKNMELAAAAQNEFNSRLDKYNSGEQKSFPSSKRLEMMKQALQESNDEITARKTLQSNLELQRKKLEALKGVK